MGFNLKTENFYFGISSFHLLKSKINLTGYDRPEANQLALHNYIFTGYKFDATKKIVVEPSVLIKMTESAAMQLDINLNVIYDELFSVGSSYRTGDGVSFLARYLINESIMIGYSYDYTLSDLSSFSNGSHEIMLGYQIKLLPPARDKVVDPRYYF